LAKQREGIEKKKIEIETRKERRQRQMNEGRRNEEERKEKRRRTQKHNRTNGRKTRRERNGGKIKHPNKGTPKPCQRESAEL